MLSEYGHLAKEWKLELKTSGSGLPSLSVEDGTGRVGLSLLFYLLSSFWFVLFIDIHFSNSRANRRSIACCGGSVGPLHGRRAWEAWRGCERGSIESRL